MYAIEFETDAKGRMIEIPQEYGKLASKHLKVIIMFDDKEDQTNKPQKTIRRLSAITLNTLNYKFDREEANAR